jgi:hypothetical protein
LPKSKTQAEIGVRSQQALSIALSKVDTTDLGKMGYDRLLAEVRQQATGNRQQWEELEFFGIKLI